MDRSIFGMIVHKMNFHPFYGLRVHFWQCLFTGIIFPKLQEQGAGIQSAGLGKQRHS
jgi:hypothetical protein